MAGGIDSVHRNYQDNCCLAKIQITISLNKSEKHCCLLLVINLTQSVPQNRMSLEKPCDASLVLGTKENVSLN
jgi:hypothetical protein